MEHSFEVEQFVDRTSLAEVEDNVKVEKIFDWTILADVELSTTLSLSGSLKGPFLMTWSRALV